MKPPRITVSRRGVQLMRAKRMMIDVTIFSWPAIVFVVGSLLTWVGAFAAHAASDSPEQAITAWVPPSVLVAVVFMLGGAWWRSFVKQQHDNTEAVGKRLDKMELTLEKIMERLPGFATTDALGRLGDRMDGRLTDVNSKLEVLKDRVAHHARAFTRGDGDE